MKALFILQKLGEIAAGSFEGEELAMMMDKLAEAERKVKAMPVIEDEAVLATTFLVSFANLIVGRRVGLDVENMSIYPEEEELLQELMGTAQRELERAEEDDCMCAKCVMRRVLEGAGAMPEGW